MKEGDYRSIQAIPFLFPAPYPIQLSCRSVYLPSHPIRSSDDRKCQLFLSRLSHHLSYFIYGFQEFGSVWSDFVKPGFSFMFDETSFQQNREV